MVYFPRTGRHWAGAWLVQAVNMERTLFALYQVGASQQVYEEACLSSASPTTLELLLEEWRQFNDLEGEGVVPSDSTYSPKEKEQLAFMRKFAKRLDDGRWQVPMLLKNEDPLPESETAGRPPLQIPSSETPKGESSRGI